MSVHREGSTSVVPTEWPAACTIVASNYLSQAQVLADSYTQHHPGAKFYILVVDPLPTQEIPHGTAHIVTLGDLNHPDIVEMQLRYSVIEFATATKATFLSYLMDVRDEDEVIYLDPDILVMQPFNELRTVWQTGDIVLTPHLLEPLPNDELEVSERSILKAGCYNLGFIAVRNSAEARRFLSWWERHLRDECLVDPCRGLMVDQRWIDLAPHFFPSAIVSLRDETYNVAYWNIYSRPIEMRGDKEFFVNGRPVVFFHFSGFDPATPRTLSKHEDRTVIADGSGLAALMDYYAELLHDYGFTESSKRSYGNENLSVGEFDNGIPTNEFLLRLYADLDPGERARFGDPRKTGGPDSFYEWATAPRPEEGNLSRFLIAVYHRRPDVAATFPDPGGRDRAAFLHWARNHGVAELHFDVRLIRDTVED